MTVVMISRKKKKRTYATISRKVVSPLAENEIDQLLDVDSHVLSSKFDDILQQTCHILCDQEYKDNENVCFQTLDNELIHDGCTPQLQENCEEWQTILDTFESEEIIPNFTSLENIGFYEISIISYEKLNIQLVDDSIDGCP